MIKAVLASLHIAFALMCVGLRLPLGVVRMIGRTALLSRLMHVFCKFEVVPQRVRGALDTLTEGVLLLDDGGKILLANSAFAASIGSSAADLVGTDACQLRWMPTLDPSPPHGSHEQQTSPGENDSSVSPEVSETAESLGGGGMEMRGGLPIDAFPWIAALRHGESAVDRRLDLIDTDGQRHNYAINAAPLGDGGEQKGALVTFQDITHREQSRRAQEETMRQLREREKDIREKNRELEILATRDALTGCLNRRAFFDQAEPLLANHRINNRPLSCFMVDVDHFKAVNDTYGHHTGDEVLRAVSAVIRELHEAEHLVCRYGGEEFCVVFPGLDSQAAIGKAEQTRLAIAAIRLAEPASLRLTASLGVSALRFDPADTQEMINQADESLYVAKRGGRNRVVGYDPRRTPVLASQASASAGSPSQPNASTAADAASGVVVEASPPAAVRLPMDLISPLVAAMTLRDPQLGRRARVHADRCLHVAEGRLEHSIAYRLEIAALLSEFGLIGASEASLRRWIDWRVNSQGDGEIQPGVDPRDDHEILRCYHNGQAMVAETFGCPLLRQILLNDVDPNRLTESQREATRLASEILRLASIDQVPPWASPLAERAAPPIRVETRKLCHDAGWLRHADEPFAYMPSSPCDGVFGATGVVPTDDWHWIRRAHDGVGEVTTGIALALQHSVSSQLRGAIAELSEALDQRNRPRAMTAVDGVGQIAQAMSLHPIQQAVDQTRRTLDDENAGWDAVLRQMRGLTQLCRKTDNAHLVRQ